jgi:hypothetical protein
VPSSYPKIRAIFSKIGIPSALSRLRNRDKSPLCGESSSNSSYGKYGWRETIDFLGSSKEFQPKLQPRYMPILAKALPTSAKQRILE